MARRVLGDDPFATKEADTASAKRARKAPASTKRAATKPAAKKRAGTAAKAPTPDVAPVVAEPLVPALEADEVVAAGDAPPDVLRTMSDTAPTETTAITGEGADVAGSIRDLEARLDQLIEATRGETQSHPELHRVAERIRQVTTPARTTSERDDGAEAARELMTSEFYLRQWGRVAMRERAESVDEFGYDPDYDRRWHPLFDFLYERWWRVEVSGVENVPATGRVALVANHSGAVPYDGIMLATALRKEHSAARQLRWLAEDFVFHLPFVGAYLTRLGAVRACQENAERLLRREHCVALFPEGVKGISKLYRDRYKLQRFGRGGHVKLAIRARTPLLPVAIVGAEEAHPLLSTGGLGARLLGLPYLPITPTFPLFGALGAVPLPSKWHIVIGEPIAVDGYSPDAADDEVLVGRLNEKLRTTIQDMLDRTLRMRPSVFGR
jgi:1-acyl-sn-glycerol-3-phosphate acyltransferase